MHSNGIDDLTLECRFLFEQSTMCLLMDQTSSASEVTNQRISCWYGCQNHNSKNSVVLFCPRYHLLGRNFVHCTSYNWKINLGNTLIIWGRPANSWVFIPVIYWHHQQPQLESQVTQLKVKACTIQEVSSDDIKEIYSQPMIDLTLIIDIKCNISYLRNPIKPAF